MDQPDKTARNKRRKLSLYIRISLWFVFAAIIPLAITLIFSEYYTRPALIAQANTSMQNDAQTRVQLIQTYFNERVLDTQTLAQVPSAQTYLNEPYGTVDPEGQRHALYTLGAGGFRDKNYVNWSLFDTQGRLRLAYPQLPMQHGQSLVPPLYRDAVQANHTVISGVYFDPRSNAETVDIYAPMIASPDSGLPPKRYLGFVRATLKLDYILNIVHNDSDSNGAGSYALILDNNGVRIATNDPATMFKAVAPLSGSALQDVQEEQLYGATNGVPVLQDNTLESNVHNNQVSHTFQMQPAEKQEMYQVVERSYPLLSWKYFVFSPVNTTAALANEQLQFTLAFAALMALIAVIVGLIAARRVAAPLTTSMKFLRSSSQDLSGLAKRQQDAASEQMWVVDSSQVGLQSIQYYTEAVHVAAHSLNETSKLLTQSWSQMEAQRVQHILEQIVAAAHYIENASEYQKGSNRKLETALQVATQVTEQLAAGATSATEAATQLEQVVERLRSVVGR